jgi:hypothetical protein
MEEEREDQMSDDREERSESLASSTIRGSERLAMACAKDPDKIRGITIKQLDLGYVVKVGCKSFAIETKEKLLDALEAYLTKPDEIENLYNKGKILNVINPKNEKKN